MDSAVIIALALIATWIGLAALVAVIVGRTAASAQNTHELEMIRREHRDAVVPPPEQRIDVSTRPRS